jgi:hypothetical protein
MWIDTKTAKPVQRTTQAVELLTLKEYHDWVNNHFDMEVLQGTDFHRGVLDTMKVYLEPTRTAH